MDVLDLIAIGLVAAVVGLSLWHAGWRKGMNDCRAHRGLPPLGKRWRRR